MKQIVLVIALFGAGKHENDFLFEKIRREKKFLYFLFELSM